MSSYGEEKKMSKKTLGAIVGGSALALFAIVGAIMTTHVDINQNESAIKTVSGVTKEDHVPEGRQWILPSLTNTFNKIDYPKITHTLQTTAITAADKGAACTKDCVNLQTKDQQAVAGSLLILWHVSKEKLEVKDGKVVSQPKEANKESVMAELYRVRGATSIEDVQEKLLVPAFLDCMISKVNATDAKDLVEKDKEVVGGIKECTIPRAGQYHLVIDDVLNRGFGPSNEARASMKQFADARQRGQVAQVELETSAKRDEAARKNASIVAGAYKVLVDGGVPKDQIPSLLCLNDQLSASRPCIPGTASGGAYSVSAPTGATAPK